MLYLLDGIAQVDDGTRWNGYPRSTEKAVMGFAVALQGQRLMAFGV